VTGGALPPGLTLQTNGQISGTPTQAGSFTFTVQVRDSASSPQTASRSLTLTIAGGSSALQITTTSLLAAVVGQAYSATLQASGGTPAYTWSITSGALPAGLTLLASTGQITGTPAQASQSSFTVQVRDSSQPAQSASKGLTLTVVTGSLDQYGGLLQVPSPNGATGHWRVEKFKGRWMFVTPDGNAFWMLGVYTVTGSDGIDESGSSYNARFHAKYPDDPTGWVQTDRRLKSWGFNTIGPFSYRMTLPTDSEPQWPGGVHPVPMPFVGLAPNPAITGRNSGASAFKNILRGLDTSIPAFSWEVNGNFPDVYDPAWQANTTKLYANDPDLAVYKTSAWFIGYFSDDTDFLTGFGPGVDFATDPSQKYHPHLGYLVLCTAPTQATNPYSSNVPYTDTKVYTKYALRDFLVAKYGTIAALNGAWGSTYTTFDSAGGWPTGNGLLDENCRSSDTWLGNQDRYYLTGMNANAKADLDAFLYEMSKKFFSIQRAGFKAVAPNALFFGPTNLGGAGWRAPTRGPILKAAGQYLDVVNIGTDGSQAQLDFVAQWAGDVPLAIWEGVTANPDSGRWRQAGEAGATWNLSTQAQRGQKYQQDVQALLNGIAAPTGSKPYVGLMWWSWLDSIGEGRNWGLVSLLDNAYDGKEAIQAAGIDPWGYPTGGEERNYGDFISTAQSTNLAILQALIAELKP
jgi:hypothetical protein